jgi:hypothetical protein
MFLQQQQQPVRLVAVGAARVSSGMLAKMTTMEVLLAQAAVKLPVTVQLQHQVPTAHLHQQHLQQLRRGRAGNKCNHSSSSSSTQV